MLVVVVVIGWISGYWLLCYFDVWYYMVGYVVGVVVVLWLVWSWMGSCYVCFVQFVCGLCVVLVYVCVLCVGCELCYVGYNLLGGWMVLLLWGVVVVLLFSGWFYIIDWLWGYEWLLDLYVVLVWGFVVFVFGYVGGVVVMSWWYCENFVVVMFGGFKCVLQYDDIG